MEETTTKRKHVSLINELIQGKELAKQLCNHLVSSSSSSSNETNEFLIEKILSTYEKALIMLNNQGCEVLETKGINGNIMMDSNCSNGNNGSPRSEVLDHEFEHKSVYKKRKTMPSWTEQVRICSRSGIEGSLNDGYSWRKYGQKDILGAKFPRGYYRCTHRNVQGCLATKQVQRSDEDPTIIEVSYRGRHTCTQSKQINNFQSKTKMKLEENQLYIDQKNQIQIQKNLSFKFETEHEVKTEEFETKEDIFPWFSFPTASFGSETEENNVLSDSMIENHFMESFSPSFVSPCTSESNLFCLSAYQNIQTSESDITEIISAPTSVTNSPTFDLDIFLHKGDFDFDSDFPVNTNEYFSS